jgi:hypothetical protein
MSSAQLPAVPKGFVRFRSGDVNVMVRVGGTEKNNAANLSEGYGGWEAVRRPRDRALVEWLGHEPMMLTIPIMFDGLRNTNTNWGASVESAIKLLEHLTHKLAGYDSPPRIFAEGDVIPFSDREWVINNIEWTGDDVRRPEDGERVRASATIELLEWVDYDVIQSKTSSAKKRKNSTSKKSVHTKQKKGKYKVKEGDTLKKIAKSELGSAAKWKDIADFNGIRDGSIIEEGDEISIP